MTKYWLILVALLIPHLISCAQVEVSLSGNKTAVPPYIFDPMDVPATPLCPLTNPFKSYKQNTGVWCWAASAQTVINYISPPNPDPVSQCAIVNNSLDVDPNASYNCCKAEDDYIPTPVEQNDPAFQAMLNRCRVRYKPLSALVNNGHGADDSLPPLNWQGLTDQLCGNHTPYIIIVTFYDDNGNFAGRHSSVIGGARVTSNGDKYVEVNDHWGDNFFLMKWEAFERGVEGDFKHEVDHINIKQH